MIDITEKLYERFAPKERIKLAIAALGRNDDSEIARLRKTCPKKEYICSDNNYVAPMETITHISLQFASLCQLFNGKTRACDLLIYTFEVATTYEHRLLLASEELEYAKFASPNLKLVNIIDEDKVEKKLEFYQRSIKEFNEVRRDHISSIKAIYQAFIDFCKQVGINSEHILAWLELPMICDDFEKYLASDVEADQEFLNQVKENFLSSWREMVGNYVSQ